jgi:hypothetical protein
MDQQVIDFLKLYQEMRSAQNKYIKTGDRLDLAKSMQIQVTLDVTAPGLIKRLINGSTTTIA